MRRLAIVTFAAGLLLATQQPAAAQGDAGETSEVPPGFGTTPEVATNEPKPGDIAATVTSRTTFVLNGQEQVLDNGVTKTVGAIREAAQAVVHIVEPPCVETVGIVNEDGSDGGSVCVRRYSCQSERIDDLYFGRISAATGVTSGHYADFLGSIAAGTTAGGAVADFDIDLTNTSLLGSLGARPNPQAIPRFSFCRDGADFLRTDPVWNPRFAWSTNVAAEYDLPSIRQDLLVSLESDLDILRPSIVTTPPVETGKTWVKFPTWLSVANAPTQLMESNESHAETMQVSVRARLVEVRFEVAGTTLVCSPSELVVYDPDIHHAVHDAPKCSHAATELDDITIEAQLTYEIDERIRQRNSHYQPWPSIGWQPHPRRPVVTIDLTPYTVEVRQLLSLNTPMGSASS